MVNIYIIAAIAKNRVIGKNNRLPWHLPNDLKHFRELTLNKTVIMGRKTCESLGKSLVQRQNIVISSNLNFQANGFEMVTSLEDALKQAKSNEVFIIGGESLYQQAMPKASQIVLTYVDAEVDGDSFFPVINMNEWEEVSRENHFKDDKHLYDYSFVTLKRRPSSNLSAVSS